MWRTDREVGAPVRATSRDIGALNRLFSEAFTERYRRDGMQGIRVPYLNPAVWQYAIACAGDGALLWRDSRGDLVAFNLAHRSGSEGWMGPLAVRIDRQAEGLGRRIVTTAVEALRTAGARTIGLETMPRTIDNIGFYSRLGFLPGALTFTLQASAVRGTAPRTSRLGEAPEARQREVLEELEELTEALAPGVSFAREVGLTRELELGDVQLVTGEDGTLAGFALWHAAPLAEGRRAEDLRILKLVARNLDTAEAIVHGVADEAARRRLPHVSVRCQGEETALYARLIAADWRVQWTDLRMTLAEFPARPVDGVVLSNWEI